MSQFLLIERIKVQNANAASGFTWGFPAITHFLGFSHHLSRKLMADALFKGISLKGCMVIAHEQQILSYKEASNTRFSQNKTAQYLGLKFEHGRLKDPAINEEAKMNMTVSLLIPVEGYLGAKQELLIDFIQNACQLQRLAGGLILNINDIQLIDASDEINIKRLRNTLLPGFVLQDRSHYLEQHYLELKKNHSQAELLDAWFDFIVLKQVARPFCELIDRHFAKPFKNTEPLFELSAMWLSHKNQPYEPGQIPNALMQYFAKEQDSLNPQLVAQWKNYVQPNEKVSAHWEYTIKPEAGFLVPIMTGYKAITEVFKAGEISGTRDSETDLCFVESVHSIGEWQSIHRLKTPEHWRASVWNYAPSEQDWYLCRQLLTEHQDLSNDEFDPYA